MNKEEILEKSRKENKNEDIYEKELTIKAERFGGIITLIIICLMYIFKCLVGEGRDLTLWGIIFVYAGSGYIYKGIKMKKTLYIVCGIIEAVAGLMPIINYLIPKIQFIFG